MATSMDRIEQYKDKRRPFIARMEDICANAGETSQLDREGQRMIFPGINPRLFDAFFHIQMGNFLLAPSGALIAIPTYY